MKITEAKIEAPFVQTETDQEYKLIRTAADAFHRCNWIVGECAAEWHRSYRRGRTDGDFGEMVGLSEDQVYQRRTVWEKFGTTYHQYPELTWTHFREAVAFDDPHGYLSWAADSGANVKEMAAYYRLGKSKGFPPDTKPSPQPKTRLKPVEDRTQEPEVVTAPKFAMPAPKSPARAEADPPDAAETVNEAIEKITSLIQFVAKNGSPVARLRMAQVVEPLLAGIKATK